MEKKGKRHVGLVKNEEITFQKPVSLGKILNIFGIEKMQV